MQSPSGIGGALADVGSDGLGIFHDLHGVFKHELIDLLQHILAALVGNDFIRFVDMPMTKHFAGDGLTVQLKR